MTRRLGLMIYAGVLLLILSAHIAAQTTGSCPTLIEQALTALGDNCEGLNRNNACYGYQQVDSTFTFDVEDGYFSDPSDRAELTTVRTIRTSPLNLVTEQWGIAVMNVQANVPQAVPGQAVTFLLVGDAEVENEVDSTSVAPESTPIMVRLQQSTAVRSNPTIAANSIAAAEAGTTFDVDAISRDTQWLRIFVNNRVGWLDRQAVIPDTTLDTLPVFSSTTRTPMQSFYFTTGFGQPDCNEAPNVVSVQSPDNLQVDLTVNGVDIRIGSTISFQQVSATQAVFMVHEGHLLTVDGQRVEAGEGLEARIDDDGGILSWEIIRPLTDEELEMGDMVMQMMSAVSSEEQLVQSPLPEVQEVTTHTVTIGDTLFNIARIYDADMGVIMDVNNILDPNTIIPGQVLTIPDAGSGFVAIPVDPNIPSTDPNNPPPSAGVDCTGFTATSPRDGLNNGITAFYWDAPAGAVSAYQVTVYNLETGRTATTQVNAPATNASIDVSVNTLGGGFDFAWDVVALFNGQPVCQSQRVSLLRAAAGVNNNTPFTATWGCQSSGIIVINFNNAPAGDTVSVSFLDAFGLPQSLVGSAPTGSLTFPTTLATGATITTSSGASVVLSPSTINCP
ncbi:MAG: LysM domain-containing protein [Aggregatilineales bacterium]